MSTLSLKLLSGASEGFQALSSSANAAPVDSWVARSGPSKNFHLKEVRVFQSQVFFLDLVHL